MQNMLACRTETDARAAALFFNIAHYAMRSWPWVITALCSLAMYGGAVRGAAGEDPGANYVRVMVDVLPGGLRGFMIASFAAAYMSTQATQMNWGSSYLVNDLYRRFVRPDATDRHYVGVARVATFVTLLLSVAVTMVMDQVSHAWEFLLMLGAGTGLVYILRWYWWRVNAWSEVSAMASALTVSLALRFVVDTSTPKGFALTLIATTGVTTIVWLTVTLLTRAEPRETLRAFYLRVRPGGPGWRAIAEEPRVPPLRGEMTRAAACWVLGIALVYSVMFATGALLFDDMRQLAMFGAVALASGITLVAVMRTGSVQNGVVATWR